jgi:protein-L-isoaspartate(D-aspartate) O-methyltransferase
MTFIDQSSLSPVEAMIESQLRVSKVTDTRVITAIRQVNRAAFIPADKQSLAYSDTNITIAPGRGLMQPLILARLLNHADILATDKVLLIGAGTGYASAVIARLAGHVVAVESNNDLIGFARATLQGIAYIDLVAGALTQGHIASAPYDVIFIDGAVEHIPSTLIDQLAETGRMVGVLAHNGVGRGFTARKAGSALGLNPFMDCFAPSLPEFILPKNFTF